MIHRNAALPATWLALALATLGAAHAAAPNSNAMTKLANQSGCLTCHHIEPGAKHGKDGLDGQPAGGPNGLAPIGPAWRDVSAKYQGQKDAQAKLTQTVLAGSNPYQSHWKGKVSGLAMPPNAVAIKAADAKRLVQWILSLEASKTH